MFAQWLSCHPKKELTVVKCWINVGTAHSLASLISWHYSLAKIICLTLKIWRHKLCFVSSLLMWEIQSFLTPINLVPLYLKPLIRKKRKKKTSFIYMNLTSTAWISGTSSCTMHLLFQCVQCRRWAVGGLRICARSWNKVLLFPYCPTPSLSPCPCMLLGIWQVALETVPRITLRIKRKFYVKMYNVFIITLFYSAVIFWLLI